MTSTFNIPSWVRDLKKERGDGVRVVRDEFVLLVFVRELKDLSKWTVTLDTKPEGRGAHAISFIRRGFAKIFTETDAHAIIGGIASNNAGCLQMVRLVGCGGELEDHGEYFLYTCTREKFMKGRDDEEH